MRDWNKAMYQRWQRSKAMLPNAALQMVVAAARVGVNNTAAFDDPNGRRRTKRAIAKAEAVLRYEKEMIEWGQRLLEEKGTWAVFRAWRRRGPYPISGADKRVRAVPRGYTGRVVEVVGIEKLGKDGDPFTTLFVIRLPDDTDGYAYGLQLSPVRDK